jgi:hypothetical protein
MSRIDHEFKAQADDDAVCTCGKAKAHHSGKAMVIRCNWCLAALTEPGALLFTPPTAYGECRKIHLCVSCYERMTACPAPSVQRIETRGDDIDAGSSEPRGRGSSDDGTVRGAQGPERRQ